MLKGRVRTRTKGKKKGKKYPINTRAPSRFRGGTKRFDSAEDERNMRLMRTGMTVGNKPFVDDGTGTKGHDSVVDDHEMVLLNAGMSEKVQDLEQDRKFLSSELLDPTIPEHRARWLKNPDQYDLIGFDTPDRLTDRFVLYRGVQGSDPDKLLSEYNKKHDALGRFWTGNIHVGRMYALNGLTTISLPSDVVQEEMKADFQAKAIRSQNENNETLAEMWHRRGWHDKADLRQSMVKPYGGVIFKADVAADEIVGFNPESFPHEYEARMDFKDKSHNWSLPDRYSDAVEIGFVELDGRTVSWHKIRQGDERYTLRELFDR